MNRPATGRARSMLDRFPAFVRADGSGKALGEVASALGASLDEAERLSTGIQRAHRLRVAGEERDVLRLAALLGLVPADFFILRRLYDHGFFAALLQKDGAPPPSAEAVYAAYLVALKDAVRRMVRIFSDGCGSIWALLEATAALLNAGTIQPAGKALIEHPDAGRPMGGFVHRTRIEYRLLESGKVVAATAMLYLIENPLRDAATNGEPCHQREWLSVTRRGFFSGPVAIRITGMGQRTIWPLIVSRARHEGVGFRGVVPDGKQLLFALDGRVYLDGVDVTAQAFYFHGALQADPSPTVEPGDSRYDGTGPKDRFITTTTAASGGTLPVCGLPLGDSRWRFSVREGSFDETEFDASVFAYPESAEEIQALPPAGTLRLEWTEHEPFAATVLLPEELKSLETDLLAGQDLRKLVRAGLERFRAAGIRLNVDYYERDWILNKSILRDSDVDSGPGVDIGGTLLPEPPEG